MIDKALRKFNRTLSKPVIRNKEVSLLHHIVEYLDELCNNSRTERIYAHTVRVLLKIFENELSIFLQQSFLLFTYQL